MELNILLPFDIFTTQKNVSCIVAETPHGSFGILPNRLDCVAALTPGILTYTTTANGEVHVAVDEGVLVKAGTEVFVSVRRALAGKNLADLRQLVEREFMTLNDEERNTRSVMAKLEAGFLRRLAGVDRG